LTESRVLRSKGNTAKYEQMGQGPEKKQTVKGEQKKNNY